MGKSFAPNYANIYLYYWEQEAFKTFKKSPLVWKRYIDDSFGIYTHGLVLLFEFLSHLKNLHHNINITFVYHYYFIPFLDITIFKHNDFQEHDFLSTRIFFKDTHTGHLIHKTSLHSSKFKKSIIRAEIFRIARKCSFKIDFDNAFSSLLVIYRSQGYSLRFLRNIKYDVLFSAGFYNSLSSYKLLLNFGFHQCGNSSCLVCSFALPSIYVFDNENNRFRILSFINCCSSNVIFSIYCSLCGPISVLFSSNNLYISILDLVNRLKNFSTDRLCHHFSLKNHSIHNFYFQGIQIVNSNLFPSDQIKNWILRLKTFSSPGINSSIFNPQIFRLVIPFCNKNTNTFRSVNNLCFNRFSINLRPSFSSYPNLKSSFCKSKFI